MRRVWLVQNNDDNFSIQIGNRRPENAVDELDPQCIDLSCYDCYQDEDGTLSWLLSEQKYANLLDAQRGYEHRLSKQK